VSANADTAARLRALGDLEATLLVEAAAGTGKTALIAGRITMLLASGCEPSNIAAITFTEAAASELSFRVHKYVDDLLKGRIPPSLAEALPSGLSDMQRVRLSSARAKLDELTASTIHGFCQTLIHSYAVESDIDPGAQIIDATQAAIAFDTVFNRWLRARLMNSVPASDPIALLSKEDPKKVVATLRAFARFRREHRTARPVPADLSGRPDVEFTEAVREFQRWFASVPAERETGSVLEDLALLAEFYKESFGSRPDFHKIWKLGHPPRVNSMRRDSFDLRKPKWNSSWQGRAGPTSGAELAAQALEHFNRAEAAYGALLGKIATALIATLSTEIDEVLAEYAAFKRAAAVLDFDDLLYCARDLIRGHPEVRSALSQRYQRILVDEFQDTDPIQAEVLFRIAATDAPLAWHEGTLRKGALFMVGDPKQAIYRFRGADFDTYELARSAIKRASPEDIIHITASFRSLPPILSHVNRCFAAPLSAAGQPGYVPLTSTRSGEITGLPCVAKKTIHLETEPTAAQVRDAEAREVADVCARLIGNVKLVSADDSVRPLAPADIALLAPTGTDLWRYEQALEDRGLPYASQAGKNLFGRQEVQDLLSIARVLADPYDTMAFGALMRGPLVGMTEGELLDIAFRLPEIEGKPALIPRFSVLTDPASVAHPVAHQVLTVLQDLRRRVQATSPMQLLSEAIERLHLRPVMATREGLRSGRAMANVDVFLQLARSYPVRGLKQFVRDITRDWMTRESRGEGRVDAEGEAIDLVTIHSSKGLEWPVVILINTATRFRSRDEFVYRSSDDTLHWVLGDVVPPDLRVALESDERGASRERERLFYVAFTRAKDLLVLPKLPSSLRSWGTIIQDPHLDLPELDLSALEAKPLSPPSEMPNSQTTEIFKAETGAIAASSRKVTWLRPSQDDLDRIPLTDLLAGEGEDHVETPAIVGAGRVRGLLLHKLLEEVLTGEVSGELDALVARAGELLKQLGGLSAPGGELPLAEELGGTVQRTLNLPDIVKLRHGLVPEVELYGTFKDKETTSLAGRADAVFMDKGRPSIVVDWKSDVDPAPRDIELHAAQLRLYMRATNVGRGALVYMSVTKVQWLDAKA